jgi:hypothetical protein
VSEPEQQKPIETPPDGAMCREHTDRPALVMCAECGAAVCIACWHHPIRRCHACLMRDPLAAAPPIPWEDPTRPAIVRFFATLASALRPLGTAPAFAHGEVGPARSFALLTILPLALLWAIVPFTQTLLFGPTFSVSVIGEASAAEIALDVARAIGLGLLLCTAQFLAIFLPYVSLTRAYAEKGHRPAPVRAVLYRGFLLPLGAVLFSIVFWAAPEGTPGEELQAIAALAQVIPLMLLFASLRASARMGGGTGPLMSLVVAIVPIVAMVMVQGLLEEALRPMRPAPAAITATTGEPAPHEP